MASRPLVEDATDVSGSSLPSSCANSSSNIKHRFVRMGILTSPVAPRGASARPVGHRSHYRPVATCIGAAIRRQEMPALVESSKSEFWWRSLSTTFAPGRPPYPTDLIDVVAAESAAASSCAPGSPFSSLRGPCIQHASPADTRSRSPLPQCADNCLRTMDWSSPCRETKGAPTRIFAAVLRACLETFAWIFTSHDKSRGHAHCANPPRTTRIPPMLSFVRLKTWRCKTLRLRPGAGVKTTMLPWRNGPRRATRPRGHWLLPRATRAQDDAESFIIHALVTRRSALQ